MINRIVSNSESIRANISFQEPLKSDQSEESVRLIIITARSQPLHGPPERSLTFAPAKTFKLIIIVWSSRPESRVTSRSSPMMFISTNYQQNSSFRSSQGIRIRLHLFCCRVVSLKRNKPDAPRKKCLSKVSSPECSRGVPCVAGGYVAGGFIIMDTNPVRVFNWVIHISGLFFYGGWWL